MRRRGAVLVGLRPGGRPGRSTGLVDVMPMKPGILLDLQNRGQLASGISTFDPDLAQLVDTY